jgi:glycosyltransferase involved in cell wall biosynthesis
MWRPAVSFCMIVRDGGDDLAACLDSVAPLVDEMVVVDTGSEDDSVAVARAHGARVSSIPWPDDFAAARNAYVAAARGDWILSLDADETIERVDPRAFREELSAREHGAYVFTIRNYFSMAEWSSPLAPSEFGAEVEPGIGWKLTRTVRLFSRRRGLRYRFPVHESLIPAARERRIPVRACAIPIHHRGPLRWREDRVRKTENYMRLGLKKLSQYPRLFLSHLELGRAYFARGDYERAERLFVGCLRLNPFCVPAYFCLTLASLRLGQPERALRGVRRGLRLFPRNVDLLYARGLAEIEAGDLISALESLGPALRLLPQRLHPGSTAWLSETAGRAVEKRPEPLA